MDFLDTLAAAQVEATIPVVQLLQIFFQLFSSLRPKEVLYPKSAHVYDGQQFDFIIVGAGSAGCIVANRLTEIGNWTVLLIEAGDEPNFLSDIPGLYALADYKTMDWGYTSVNDCYSSQAYKAKSIRIPRGKMISGSSGSTYLYYVRGNKADYDSWVEQGNEGWDYESALKYFKKSENLQDVEILEYSGEYHNTKGPMGVTRPFFTDTLPYIGAFIEAGYKYVLDYNGEQQMGYSIPQINAANGARQSTGEAFLKPIKNRPNLFLLTKTLATKVIIDCDTAVGVQVKLSNNKVIELFANNEVILSAGAINTPQLLMLSGIGPEEHLISKGIEVVLDSPLVGQTLQDHPMVPLVLTGKRNFLSFVNNINMLTYFDKFPPSIVGHVALDKSQSYPDYQSTFLSVPASSLLTPSICANEFRLEDEICRSLVRAGQLQETLFVYLVFQHPKSRGRVMLRSKNPEDKPLIYTGYFSHQDDLEKFALCLEDFLKVLNTPYFKSFNSQVINMNVTQCNHLKFSSHEYWKCFILNLATTEFHSSCTCPMGPNGVVDERLNLRGIQNLRIVDASVMPTIVSGNINAAVMMIAEKGADMIKCDYGVI